MDTRNELFFKRLFDKTHGKTVNFLRSLCHDQDVAHEVAQIAFIKIWKSIDKYVAHPNPEALVYVTVKHVFLDEIKKRYRSNAMLTSLEDHAHLTRTVADPHSPGVITGELAGAVNRAVSKLPEQVRKIYSMYQFGEMNTREITEKLQVSSTTVRTSIETARRILRNELSGFNE